MNVWVLTKDGSIYFADAEQAYEMLQRGEVIAASIHRNYIDNIADKEKVIKRINTVKVALGKCGVSEIVEVEEGKVSAYIARAQEIGMSARRV